MKHVLQDIAAFFKGHWPHVIVAIPTAVAFTALHEVSHCVAVWMQGGTVTEFVWLPSGSEWGHMRYSFPSGVQYSATAVSLCPYVLWVSLCLFAGVLAFRQTPWPFWCASTIFVWLFIVPLADIANTAAPYLLWDADNDFQHAFGPSRPSFVATAVALGAVFATCGFLLNKRLYRDRAVGFPTYCVLAATATLAILTISCFRLA